MADLTAEPHKLVCAADGVFIWPGKALVEKRGGSFARVSERDIANLAGVLFGAEVLYGPLIPTLERTARFLEHGQLAAAQEAITKLTLPPLTAFGERLTRIAPGFFDPDKHPRWPAGSPDRSGGEFRPADGSALIPVADKTPPELPKDRLPTPKELNRYGRLQSEKLNAKLLSEGEGFSRGAAIAQLVASLPMIVDNAHAVYSRIVSRFDEPMTIDDLIARSYSDSPPSWPAYEQHHIVEETPNRGTIPEDVLQSPANVVRIPYYIHRDISDFYSTPNEDYGWSSPRDYLRGKSFEEQYQFGLKIMRDFGVLK